MIVEFPIPNLITRDAITSMITSSIQAHSDQQAPIQIGISRLQLGDRVRIDDSHRDRSD